MSELTHGEDASWYVENATELAVLDAFYPPMEQSLIEFLMEASQIKSDEFFSDLRLVGGVFSHTIFKEVFIQDWKGMDQGTMARAVDYIMDSFQYGIFHRHGTGGIMTMFRIGAYLHGHPWSNDAAGVPIYSQIDIHELQESFRGSGLRHIKAALTAIVLEMRVTERNFYTMEWSFQEARSKTPSKPSPKPSPIKPDKVKSDG